MQAAKPDHKLKCARIVAMQRESERNKAAEERKAESKLSIAAAQMLATAHSAQQAMAALDALPERSASSTQAQTQQEEQRRQAARARFIPGTVVHRADNFVYVPDVFFLPEARRVRLREANARQTAAAAAVVAATASASTPSASSQTAEPAGGLGLPGRWGAGREDASPSASAQTTASATSASATNTNNGGANVVAGRCGACKTGVSAGVGITCGECKRRIYCNERCRVDHKLPHFYECLQLKLADRVSREQKAGQPQRAQSLFNVELEADRIQTGNDFFNFNPNSFSLLALMGLDQKACKAMSFHISQAGSFMQPYRFIATLAELKLVLSDDTAIQYWEVLTGGPDRFLFIALTPSNPVQIMATRAIQIYRDKTVKDQALINCGYYNETIAVAGCLSLAEGRSRKFTNLQKLRIAQGVEAAVKAAKAKDTADDIMREAAVAEARAEVAVLTEQEEFERQVDDLYT